jgi:hypothetical protein
MANTLEACTHSGPEPVVAVYHLEERGKALLVCTACGATRKIVTASQIQRDPWVVPSLLVARRAAVGA